MTEESEAVCTMFNAISSRYDRLNKILSLGLDRYWRKAVCRSLPKKQKIKLLDCATGTGDQLIALLKTAPNIYDAVGIDPAEEMVARARLKIASYPHSAKILLASAEAIPFPDNMFDVVTVSFGIRNFANLEQGLKEIYRVLSPKGKMIILEFSHPRLKWIRFLHNLYVHRIVPKIGSLLSGHKNAYSYLSKTIEQFPQGEALCKILQKAEFKNIEAKPLTLGTVTLYTGEKVYFS